MYSKDINRVVSQNVDFKRIVSEGGYCGKQVQYLDQVV